jgi:hypothetical protein
MGAAGEAGVGPHYTSCRPHERESTRRNANECEIYAPERGSTRRNANLRESGAVNMRIYATECESAVVAVE